MDKSYKKQIEALLIEKENSEMHAALYKSISQTDIQKSILKNLIEIKFLLKRIDCKLSSD